MKRAKHFVFDTNVVLSAMLFPGSKPGLSLKKGFNIGVVVVSEETIEELTKVVFYVKFDKYVPLALRQLFLQQYEIASSFIMVTKHITLCRDPNDDKFLSLAKEAKASTIITGDEDLLVLNPFDDIAILTPDEFLKKY